MEIKTYPLDLESILQTIAASADPKPDLLPLALKELKIVIKGQSGFCSEQARSLDRLQTIYYQLAARILLGDSAEAKILRDEDRQRYKLSFAAASDARQTDIAVPLLFGSLSCAIFSDKHPQARLCLAALLSAAFLGHIKDDETISPLADKVAQLGGAPQSSGQLQKIVCMAGKAGDKAAREFAANLKGAAGLEYGARIYAASDLFLLQTRPPKPKLAVESSPLPCLVRSLKLRERLLTAQLYDLKHGELFAASFYLWEDEDPYDDAKEQENEELIAALTKSFLKGCNVPLEIIKLRNPADGSVARALITGLAEDCQARQGPSFGA